jgi:hypothetical protein
MTMPKPEYKRMQIMITPLQRAVGFHVSELTYDKLDWLEQIVLDLKIEGFTNVDIAGLIGKRPVDIKHIMEVIRTKLANSELRFHLEMRAFYKDQSVQVVDEGDLSDAFSVQNMLTDEGKL